MAREYISIDIANVPAHQKATMTFVYYEPLTIDTAVGRYLYPLEDGGTRTAAITGAWVALHDCIQWMKMRDMVKDGVLRDQIAAVSCGLYKGEAVLDLDYAEDSNADADANFVMTGSGGIIEIQGTAEGEPFSEEMLGQLLGLAKKGIGELVAMQKKVLA